MDVKKWTDIATVINGFSSVCVLVFAYVTIRQSAKEYFHTVLTGMFQVQDTMDNPRGYIIDSTELLLSGFWRKSERKKIYTLFAITEEEVKARINPQEVE